MADKRGKVKKTWENLSAKQQVLVFVIGVAVLVGVAILSWFFVSIQPVDRSNETFVEIEVRPDASTHEVAAILSNNNLIKSDLAFIILARLNSAHIEAGTHEIAQYMSASEIIKKLSSAAKSTYLITILPEMSIIEIKELFKKYDFSNAEIDKALTKTYSHPLLASKPADLDLEGYIYPDTYEMRKNDSLETLIEKTFDNLYNRLSRDGSLASINSKDLNIHETLTLASIVGKEAPGIDDQKIVAGVFWNRLNDGMPLGSDVTFKYAYKMGYCSEDSPACESAWNTRKHAGLTPGPISNMKYDTIQAVLNPTASDYYYFVAGDDGTIYYAATEDEHHENVYNYCTELCQ